MPNCPCQIVIKIIWKSIINHYIFAILITKKTIKMRKNSVKRIYKRLYLLTRKTADIKLYYQVSTLLKYIKTPKIIIYKQLTMFNNEN